MKFWQNRKATSCSGLKHTRSVLEFGSGQREIKEMSHIRPKISRSHIGRCSWQLQTLLRVRNNFRYLYFPTYTLHTCVCTHTRKHYWLCLPVFKIIKLYYGYVSFYVNTIKYLRDTCYLLWYNYNKCNMRKIYG